MFNHHPLPYASSIANKARQQARWLPTKNLKRPFFKEVSKSAIRQCAQGAQVLLSPMQTARLPYSAGMICTSSTPHTAAASASEWVQNFAHVLPPHAHVLDIACGSGRHAAYLTQLGHQVTGIDRDAQALAQLPSSVHAIHADIENAGWPLPEQQFDAVVVTNYLWRTLWPQVLNSVCAGGVLIYETFAQGNEAYGKPSRPDFLLMPGELLQVCAGWHVVAYEHGLLRQPDRVVQRIVASKPQDSSNTLLPLRA